MATPRVRLTPVATAAALFLAGCAVPEGNPSRPGDDDLLDARSAGHRDDRVGALSAEAGFIDVPGSATIGPGWPSRMFYSFRPAEQRPEDAPLLLLFNGGPGAATTGTLLPYGTGPATLDPAAPQGDAPIENGASYTRFANLLYVDARSTGFSYDLEAPGPPGCRGHGLLHVADAADFIHVLLEFLAAHEALRDNPVVLVGESYGGARAPLMLYMMQHYTARGDVMDVMSHAPPWLGDRMQAHIDAAFPARAGAPLGPSEVAEQFGWQILIQPSIAGIEQALHQGPLAQADPDLAGHFAEPWAWDEYDVRRTSEEAQLADEQAARAMRSPERLAALLGVDLGDIAGLAPPARGRAARYLDGHDAAAVAARERDLRAELGALEDGDVYWLPLAQPCSAFSGDRRSLFALSRVAPHTATFITNGRYDAVVYTEALPSFLATYLGLDAEVDADSPPGAARPGVLRLRGEETDVSIRFPTYEAGHKVSVGAPRALAEDVAAWLAETGASPLR